VTQSSGFIVLAKVIDMQPPAPPVPFQQPMPPPPVTPPTIPVELPENFNITRRKILILNIMGTLLVFLGFMVLSFWLIDLIEEEIGMAMVLEASAGIFLLVFGCISFFLSYYFLRSSVIHRM
jgi:hypothetical protein